jgi:hypothetical protein
MILQGSFADGRVPKLCQALLPIHLVPHASLQGCGALVCITAEHRKAGRGSKMQRRTRVYLGDLVATEPLFSPAGRFLGGEGRGKRVEC